MTRQTMIASRQKRVAPQDSDPAFWTDERVAAMDVMFRRSEFDVRTKGTEPGKTKVERHPRWRPFTASRTKHLFEPNDPVLTAKNVGPAIKALIDWGYIHRISTSVAKVEFTIKGWAWLAFKKKFDPAWFDVIFNDHADRDLVWSLYRQFRNSDKLRASAAISPAFVEKVINDITEPSPMTDNMPFVEPPSDDELPGLPQFDDEVTGILERRAADADEVERRRLQLARDFHHKTGLRLNRVEPREIADAIRKHFTPDEIVRADLEMLRATAIPKETYYSRELVNRMSAAGDFKAHSLADHLGTGHAKLEGLSRGAERIAFGLEAQALREEGISRAMPGSTTLGDIADRLRAESVSAMGVEDEVTIPDPNTIMDNGKPYGRDEAIADVISHGEDFRTALTAMRDNAAPATEDSDDVGYWQRQLNVLDRILLALDIAAEPQPVEASPENIAAASEAAKAEDDALPMVDWIDRRLGQYDYDGWVPKGNAALVAREAVLRHMRQNPMGAPVSGEGRITHYDGACLHVRQRDYMAFAGRPCTITMSVVSDYDEKDTAEIEAWFYDFIDKGTKAMRGELVERDDSFAALRAKAARHYAYPAGANVDHQVVGELEDIKVRSINPIWMVAMMFGSAFLALILFVILLSVLPIKGA